MLRLITLHGDTAGYAVLNTGARSASFELHLRQYQNAEPLEVYLVSPNGFVRAATGADLCGTGAIGDARGIVLLRGNTVAAFGANGMSAPDIEKAKERILLSLPQQKKNAAGGLPPAERDRARTGPPQSAAVDDPAALDRGSGFTASSEAGKRIIESARELFSGRGKGSCTEADAAPGGMFVGNPFPRLFGRSARFYRVSEAELRGTAVFRGKKVEVAAVRSYGRAGLRAPHTRAFRAADRRGKPYWIVINPGREPG